MTYEQGFTQGERDAFKDRQGYRLPREIAEPQDDYQRGYRDGYTPRSAEWWRVARAVPA